MNQQLKPQQNKMRMIKLEKVTLSCGGKSPELEKSAKLLEMISGMKAQIIKAGPKTRIPDFGVRPGLEVGTRVTLRGENAENILKRLLAAIDNSLSKKQIAENSFSFGIKEYIEIPGMEYKREIGIRGLNVTASFIRAGARVKRKKIKSGRVPQKQNISKQEIIEFMEDNFDAEVN